MEADKKKKDEKKPEAAEPQMVKEMPPMVQAPGLRMMILETNGTRAEVRPGCTMQAQEALQILSDVSQLIRREIQNSPPLHPAPMKLQAPAPAEAKA